MRRLRCVGLVLVRLLAGFGRKRAADRARRQLVAGLVAGGVVVRMAPVPVGRRAPRGGGGARFERGGVDPYMRWPRRILGQRRVWGTGWGAGGLEYRAGSAEGGAMSVKGSWSRVKDRESYGRTLDEIRAREKRRRARLERERERAGKNGGIK
jgi:hypothetical protein